MATIIQHRRGAYTNFDPQKMKPGEWAVVQSGDPDAVDGEAVYMAFQAGVVKRMATIDELQDYNSQSQTILNNVTNIANQVATNASNASQKAAQAEQSAQDAETAATNASNTLNSVQSTVDNLKEQAIQDITEAAEQKKSDALDEIQAQYNQDLTDFNQVYTQARNAIETRAQEIASVVVDANAIASRALAKATDVENELAEESSKTSQMLQLIRTMRVDVDQKVAGGYADSEGYLVLTDVNGDQIGDRLGPFAGGGGGGGGGSTTGAELTAQNTTGWISNTISEGVDCIVKILWSSIENEMPTGNGTATIRVNNVVKSMFEIPQGEISINLTPYLSSGTNNVKVIISDTYGQQRPVTFNVQVITLKISSTFDANAVYDNAIQFPYTPVGDVAKDVYFIVDGQQVAVHSTSVSGRQLTQTIPAQSHGAHSLRVYFESIVNNQTVRSNELYYEFKSVETLNNTPIITSSFNRTSVQQYESVPIAWSVYTPNSATSEVKLYINNNLVSTQTVDRSEQSYTFRANDDGNVVFKIESGTQSKTITFTVTPLDIDVEAETENLALYLSSQGRSNNEEHPETWTYNDISTTFTGFNGTSDRWQTDADGITVCRVSGNARLNIAYKPFAQDFRTTGKTIEIEFATRNILDYDAVILSCMSGDRGLALTAQRAILRSEQSSISTQYKEDEHVRISFVCDKRSQDRLLFIYINGICSGVIQYPDDDDFAQTNPVNITVGSNDCTIDLYNIRVYDNNLTKEQVLNNWIADTQVGSLMLDRYTHNNVYDAYGNIVISKLPSDLPYLIIECDELPQYKGDKKTCNINFVHPLYPSRNFTATKVQIDVQGTSSQYYERKNYKTKHKNGFDTTAGNIAKYAMNNDAIATNSFCYKADVASSEGANNVELARLYNDVCPYKTPAQVENSKVRQGIDGFPMVVFWHDTAEDVTIFLGKYNYNNDKGTEEVFGFASPDESIEIKNNTGLRVLFKSADYSGTDYLNDFEWRYPDTDPAYTNPAQLKEFAEWAMSTDPEQANNSVLPNPVTYDDVTYTNDTEEYRLAKFKAEAWNYMERDSTLFFYLFTELFLMVDNRAKNAFPSFIGSSTQGGN